MYILLLLIWVSFAVILCHSLLSQLSVHMCIPVCRHAHTLISLSEQDAHIHELTLMSLSSVLLLLAFPCFIFIIHSLAVTGLILSLFSLVKYFSQSLVCIQLLSSLPPLQHAKPVLLKEKQIEEWKEEHPLGKADFPSSGNDCTWTWKFQRVLKFALGHWSFDS